MTVAGLAHLQKPLELCSFCPKLCRFACPVAEGEMRESVTPWGLMTLADDLRRGFVEFTPELADLWSHCTGCNACTAQCKHENPVATTIYELRSLARKMGHEYGALDEWADERFEPVPELVDHSEDAPQRLLIPGQMLRDDLQQLVELLKHLKIDGLGVLDESHLMGSTRDFEAGRLDVFADYLERLTPKLIGITEIICVDPSDWWVLEENALRLPQGIRIRHISHYVFEKIAAMEPVYQGDVLYLDNCRIGRDEVLCQQMRKLVESCVEGSVQKPVMNGVASGCCGFGAGYAAMHPEMGSELAADYAAAQEDLPLIAFGSCVHHLQASLPHRQVLSWMGLVNQALSQRA